MGRQPFGLASPAAWLRDAGHQVTCVGSVARTGCRRTRCSAATLVGFFLPMHTATRLALPVIDRVRRLNPDAKIVAYGLYAPLNEQLLRERGVDVRARWRVRSRTWSMSPHCTEARAGSPGTPGRASPAESRGSTFKAPVRDGPAAVGAVRGAAGRARERRIVGYTEASRGCKHRCRHCPIVPVYDGRFRIVSAGRRASRTPARRSRPARGTSRSVIRTSSTASATRGRSSSDWRANVPASPTT